MNIISKISSLEHVSHDFITDSDFQSGFFIDPDFHPLFDDRRGLKSYEMKSADSNVLCKVSLVT